MSQSLPAEIVKILTGIRNPRVMREFLKAILTPQELARVALRWRLVCLLKTGMRQRAIAAKLGVSLCKITRGSRELKTSRALRAVVGKALAARRLRG